VPEKCGRVVSDTLVSKGEVESLLNLVTKGMSLGGSEGGASILDLHSGALSQGSNFVDFYKLPEAASMLQQSDFITYKFVNYLILLIKATEILMFNVCLFNRVVRRKIQHAISHHFGVDVNSLYLTHPTFFSRLTNLSPKTVHDEYWHRHVDKVIHTNQTS
jgi:hypothetical protein